MDKYRFSPEKIDHPLFACFHLDYKDFSDPEFLKNLQELRSGCSLLCLEGSVRLYIGDADYELGKCNFCTTITDKILAFKDPTADFEGYLFLVDPSFFETLDAHISITYFLYSRLNPVVSFPAEEIESIRVSIDTFVRRKKRRSHPYQKEVIKQILSIMLYEVCALYDMQDKQKEKPTGRRLRDQELLTEFLFLVQSNFREERSVKFYADKLLLTPKYLSSSIKRLSDRTAAEWIDYIVVQNIKSVLLSTHMTVQQVSDHMNFPNASFFGRFFKKHTGQTPRDFKNKVLSSL